MFYEKLGNLGRLFYLVMLCCCRVSAKFYTDLRTFFCSKSEGGRLCGEAGEGL